MVLVRSFWKWFCSRFLLVSWLTSTGGRWRSSMTVHWLADGWHRRWSWLIQMRVVMALTERPGSQPPKKTQAPGGCSFNDYSRKLESLQVFLSFLHHTATCLKKQHRYISKQHDDLLTCETDKYNLTHWVNAFLIATAATILISTWCLAVYFNLVLFTWPWKTFTKTSHVQNPVE